jgi:hypothetical protein
MSDERELECESCEELYRGEDAIRSYLREIDVPGGTKMLCLRCLTPRTSGGRSEWLETVAEINNALVTPVAGPEMVKDYLSRLKLTSQDVLVRERAMKMLTQMEQQAKRTAKLVTKLRDEVEQTLRLVGESS